MSKARQRRLDKARAWYPKQNFTEDSHVIKAYRERFGVNKICAMRELCMLGLLDPKRQRDYERQLAMREQKMAERRERRQRRKMEGAYGCGDVYGWDADFFFVAGHTSGGAPYGVTWEEAENLGLGERDAGERAPSGS